MNSLVLVQWESFHSNSWFTSFCCIVNTTRQINLNLSACFVSKIQVINLILFWICYENPFLHKNREHSILSKIKKVFFLMDGHYIKSIVSNKIFSKSQKFLFEPIWCLLMMETVYHRVCQVLNYLMKSESISYKRLFCVKKIDVDSLFLIIFAIRLKKI